MTAPRPTYNLPPLGAIKGAARGAHGHPLYGVWHKAVRRCHIEKDGHFDTYGKVGIKMCDQWRESFLAFVAALPPRPPGTQLDRFPDVNGNYEPGNVRWATPRQNTNNRRNTFLVEWQGKQVPLTEIAEQFGIRDDVVRHRIRKFGWSVERALTTPVQPRGGDYRLGYEQRAHVKAANRSTRKAA